MRRVALKRPAALECDALPTRLTVVQNGYSGDATLHLVSSCELGQDRPNRGPRSGFAFDHQTAPVGVDDMFDDREP